MDLVRRPGLAYQHAFDWLAVKLYSTDGPAVYAVGSDWQLSEMASRLPNVPTLSSDAATVEAVSRALGLTGIRMVELAGETWAAVGLVEPERIERGFLDSIPPGARLYVVAGGRLARFLAERKTAGGRQPMTANSVVGAAQAAGFRVIEFIAIHPLPAILEHYAGVSAVTLGRRDIRDRRHFAMRRAMVANSQAAMLSALVCLALERA